MATCAFELTNALAALPGVHPRLMAPAAAGAEEFDRDARFETLRASLPGDATRALPALAWWIGREARRWRPDAVLSLLWHPCGLASLIGLSARGLAATPRFVMAHGVEIMESRSSLKKRLRARFAFAKRAVFARARGVFPVSRYTAGLVARECGVPEERLHVVLNGVDTRAFHPAPRSPDLVHRYGLAGRRLFLTVTRLEPYKGVDRAVGALRYLVARHPDVLYLVCGEGGDRPRLEALVRRFGLQRHVLLAGRVPADRLREFYNLADCFVLVSREDRAAPEVEGFGIVFLEAAACGVPAIAGRSGGIPDAVEEGVGGWLVDPENEYEISLAMLECLEAPGRAEARGRAALRRVTTDLTWERMASRVLGGIAAHVRD